MACLLIAAAVPAFGAQTQSPFETESLTYKQLTGRLDQVHYDLQSIDRNIEQFRKDFSSGLGNAAAIRVLDIGVALVRDRVALNRLPRMIGAMNREGRPDWLQRQRKNELDTRYGTIFSKHGELNRVLEGYAADLKQRFGIDIKRFLDAVGHAIETGASEDEIMRAIDQGKNAIYQGNAQAFENTTRGLETGQPTTGTGTITPGTGTGTTGQQQVPQAKTVVSVRPDPNNPNNLIVTYSDGSQVSVPYERDPSNPNQILVTLPDGTVLRLPARADPNNPGKLIVTNPDGSTSSIAAPGGGLVGPLPPGVSRNPDGTFKIVMPDGTERYFPADLTRPGIGTRYLGDKGTRLIEEVEEFLDLSGGGSYQIRQGQSIRWQFAITPTGQEAAPGGGTSAKFRLADRLGQGQFTVSGWRITRPDGAELASGAGEEATAVFTQSGNYKIEFSGSTSRGSPFRIEVQIPMAVQ